MGLRLTRTSLESTQLGDAEVGDFLAGGDGAGFAEVGVGEHLDGAGGGGFDGSSARLLEERGEIVFRVRGFFLGGEDQVIAGSVPEVLERLVAGRGVEGVEAACGDLEVGFRGGEHLPGR